MFTEIVRSSDATVGDPPRELELSTEAGDGGVRLQVLRPERLDRDELVQLQVARAIDRAHPPRSQHLEHLVPIGEQLTRETTIGGAPIDAGRRAGIGDEGLTEIGTLPRPSALVSHDLDATWPSVAHELSSLKERR
jgi:hypothetical protein